MLNFCRSVYMYKEKTWTKDRTLGMPDNTGQLFDVWPSTTTLWNLCDNHAPIQFDVLLFIPIRFNLRISSLWWSTLSKALEKSITATSVCLPLAMLSNISWVNVSNCVSQLSFDLKLCWSTGTRIQDPLFPHLVPPAIMVWIFVWKYIFESFIHILQHVHTKCCKIWINGSKIYF